MRSTAQAASDWLREAIMNGDLEPGERLIEQKLASRLGIGQPTLREALKDLELEGFVRKTPKRGTYVTKLTKDDFRKSLEVRMTLEATAIERAAVRLSQGQLAALESCITGMQDAADAFVLADFHAHDVRFHEILWEAADNDFLKTALERSAFGLFAFVLLQREPGDRGEFRAAVQQHRDMLDGLRSGNPKTARKAFIDATLRFWNENHGLGLGIRKGFVSALWAG